MVLSPAGFVFFVPDLGLDRIPIYRVDEAKRPFTPNDPLLRIGENCVWAPGTSSFAPEARFAYAVCEMGSSVVAFSYDRQSGKLTLHTDHLHPAI